MLPLTVASDSINFLFVLLATIPKFLRVLDVDVNVHVNVMVLDAGHTPRVRINIV